MKKRVLISFFCLFVMLPSMVANNYKVLSITGNVLLENHSGMKREVRLRETLSAQTKISLPYNARLELFDEQNNKKYTIKSPGSGVLSAMLKDRQNSMMNLTGQYLSYIKKRLNGNGEHSACCFSDPATVTREIAVNNSKEETNDDDTENRGNNDSFFQRAKEEFDEFTANARKEYDDFRREAIKEYANFMREAWQEVRGDEPRQLPVKIETPPTFTPTGSIAVPIESRRVGLDGALTLLPVIHQPEPIYPIKEHSDVEQEYVEFSFYGTPMRVRFNRNEVFHIGTLTEEHVADAYEQVANRDFNNTIFDCLEQRNNLQLGDWAYLQLLDSLSHACYTSSNEATLLMACLYQQSGYQMRLARSDDRLVMLYGTNHYVYMHPYWPGTSSANFFYVYGGDVDELRTCNVEYRGEKPMSLVLSQRMLLAEDRSEERIITSKYYSDMKFSVSVNKNLINFYNSYPTSASDGDFMTRWAMYSNLPFDEELQNTLLADMREKLKGMSQTKAVGRLLNWIQTGFEYEYDNEVWGEDRAFFPEESLFYPYCDCEDRSILLSRLVHDILGLKVLLVYYPGHIMTAIRITDEDPKGSYLMVSDNKFLLSDPTYITASAGNIPGKYVNEKACVIVAQQ